MSLTPLVSIIIPTSQEEDYIVDTLLKMSRQNTWPSIEVIVIDYDPKGKHRTFQVMKRLPNRIKKNIRIMKTTRNGIGFARHAGAVGSRGSYLMSFDADAHFEHTDSVRRLVEPLMTGRYVMSYCNTSINTRENPQFWWSDIGNTLQQIGLSTIAHELGFTMERNAYFTVGGYKDVHRSEASILTMDITKKFGRSKIKFVNSVWVRASARRMVGSGGIMGDTDYNVAYR